MSKPEATLITIGCFSSREAAVNWARILARQHREEVHLVANDGGWSIAVSEEVSALFKYWKERNTPSGEPRGADPNWSEFGEPPPPPFAGFGDDFDPRNSDYARGRKSRDYAHAPEDEAQDFGSEALPARFVDEDEPKRPDVDHLYEDIYQIQIVFPDTPVYHRFAPRKPWMRQAVQVFELLNPDCSDQELCEAVAELFALQEKAIYSTFEACAIVQEAIFGRRSALERSAARSSLRRIRITSEEIREITPVLVRSVAWPPVADRDWSPRDRD